MNWKTARKDLKSDQARTRNIELNQFIVRGGDFSYKSTKQRSGTNLIATVFSFSFSPLSHRRSLTLYSSLWTILILHLLIIWALTWVPVPSNTLFGFLWVVIAKATLFKGLLHINAAKRVVVVHLMRWKQFSLRYFLVPITLVRLWCTSLSLEFPGGSP